VLVGEEVEEEVEEDGVVVEMEGVGGEGKWKEGEEALVGGIKGEAAMVV